MIQNDKFSNINLTSDEGKLLLAAISLLTSIDESDLKKKRFGGSVDPDTAFKSVVDLTNRIFYEEAYIFEKKRKRIEKKRSRMINKILN